MDIDRGAPKRGRLTPRQRDIRNRLFRLGWQWTKGEGWRCGPIDWPVSDEQAWAIHRYAMERNRATMRAFADGMLMSVDLGEQLHE